MITAKGRPHKIIKMKCKTLETVLVEAECPRHIDLLVLDTEGSEEFILKSFNFNRFHFHAILLEVAQSSFDFAGFLSSFGYTKVRQIKGDAVFIHGAMSNYK